MSGITLDQLIAGIRQIESGGNYAAHNPSGAWGAYQVMASNIPEWTRQAIGRSMTVAEFVADRAAQDAVARFKLGQAFRKYGAAGAAAVWFSGRPDPYSQASDGYNTVQQYVSKVMKAAGGALGPGGGGADVTYSGGGYAGGGTVTPKLDDRTLATLYGLSYSEINSDKELKNLFRQAVAQSWKADVFTAHLKNTAWWRNNSDTMRQYLDLRYSDPANFAQKWAAAVTHANDLMVQVGLSSRIGQGTTQGKMNGFLENAAYKIMAQGWSDAQLKDWLGSMVITHGGQMWGEAGQNFDKLHQIAYQQGMSYSQSWYQSQVKGVMSGKLSMEQLDAQIRSQAAARYKGFAPQIKAGMNALDLAAPYIKTVSSLLELPDTAVDLSNRWVSRAMTQTQKDGSPYALWQLENDVRADPTWRKTKNAQDNTMALAHQVLQDFGLAF